MIWILFFLASAFADQVPPALNVGPDKVIFMDLSEVRAEMRIAKASVTIHARMHFKIAEDGRPFLMLPAIAQDLRVTAGGRALRVTPSPAIANNAYLLESLKTGEYQIDVDYKLPDETMFNATGDVDFFTTMGDLKDSAAQFYLDATFPTNLLFDSYKFTLDIKVVAPATYDIMANGSVSGGVANQFSVQFPDWYASDCFFLRIFRKGSVEVQHAMLKRLDGTDLPTTVECPKDKTEICAQTLAELAPLVLKYEARLGPFPHKKLLVRVCEARPCHSMEYSGALETRYSEQEQVVLNLEHEFLHSWFGRSVHFRSGGDAWLDEALVIWAFIPRWTAVVADANLVASLNEPSTYPYAQYTSGDPYRWGPQILERLNQDLAEQGGLLPVLRAFHDRYQHSTIRQREFFDFVIAAAQDSAARVKLTTDLALWP